jgi:hypothetical protein
VDKLPANVTVTSNLNGLVGGVSLWGNHRASSPDVGNKGPSG